MKALRNIGLLLATVWIVASCGMSKIKDISVTSVGVAYIVPTSLRSMDAKLQLGIKNPSISFAVQEVSGTIHYKDKPIAHFNTGSIELQGKSEQVYDLPCTVSLADEVSLLDVLVIASGRTLEGLTADVDIQTGLKKNGILRAPLKFRKLELTRFSK